jgi:FkbM family methyltransferase
MGNFKVDAFEPNLKNTLRFCESLALNGWKDEQQGNLLAGSSSSVTIWPAGVSDTPGKLQFFEDPGNPGGGRFGGTYMNRADPQELPVTTLDKFATDRNWFETRPNIAILKVDVERHEANVLVGAAKLLKARIVKNVFTELSLEDPKHREMNVAALQLLVEAGYTLAGQGGWPGPGNASPWAHDENLVKNIFAYLEKEVKEQKKSYLNLWWTM